MLIYLINHVKVEAFECCADDTHGTTSTSRDPVIVIKI